MKTTKLLLDPVLGQIVRDMISSALDGEFDIGQLTLDDTDGQPVELLIRATASITLGLVATNLGGILIVAVWAFLSGGILSIALPAFLANIALLGTFGNVPIHAGHGGRAGSGAGFPLPGYDAGLDARVHGRGIRLAGIDADLDAGFGGDRGARGILSGARPRIGQDAIA